VDLRWARVPSDTHYRQTGELPGLDSTRRAHRPTLCAGGAPRRLHTTRPLGTVRMGDGAMTSATRQKLASWPLAGLVGAAIWAAEVFVILATW